MYLFEYWNAGYLFLVSALKPQMYKMNTNVQNATWFVQAVNEKVVEQAILYYYILYGEISGLWRNKIKAATKTAIELHGAAGIN